MGFAPVKDAIEAISRGEIVIVVDSEDRENEGDLIMAAEAATPEKIAFFLAHTSGVICVPLTPERLDELDLPLMVSSNTESQRTAFTVSVDARLDTTTGISASDRAATVRALVDPKTKPDDLNRPGHIFPLRYRPGGVLKRAGHTEAAVDLARLAGMAPAGVLCEVVSADKSQMARLEELEAFAELHGMPLISIADLVRHRSRTERLVKRIAGPVRIPSEWGDFSGYAYESVLDGEQHLAVVAGQVSGKPNVLVRVHSECLTGDVFGSLRCDCGPQLHAAFGLIAQEGSGVVVYLRGHEGRGIGLAHKLRAYSLQEQGHDTVDANLELGLPVDSREYGIGAQILMDLGVTTMRVMTNNPMKYTGLDGYGLDVVGRVPLSIEPNIENRAYLMTKRDRLGHLLTGLDVPDVVGHGIDVHGPDSNGSDSAAPVSSKADGVAGPEHGPRGELDPD
ncbi:MAG: bifunctional 3,4-dihydroxy-2-butanone-4-phosphate synthase/GTP cyclohydrolase II [Acidimicrobiales bacterium]